MLKNYDSSSAANQKITNYRSVFIVKFYLQMLNKRNAVWPAQKINFSSIFMVRLFQSMFMIQTGTTVNLSPILIKKDYLGTLYIGKFGKD